MRADQHEFVALLEQHQRLVLKVCWAYATDPYDRDDLMQEIVSQLWSSFGRYDRGRKFSTWMYRVALNVAIDFRRKKLRRTREMLGWQDTDGTQAADCASDRDHSEQLAELRHLLDQQPDEDRALLLLYLEGNSYREIGEVLGISASNVGTRLSRIKETLRVTLGRTTA